MRRPRWRLALGLACLAGLAALGGGACGVYEPDEYVRLAPTDPPPPPTPIPTGFARRAATVELEQAGLHVGLGDRALRQKDINGAATEYLLAARIYELIEYRHPAVAAQARAQRYILEGKVERLLQERADAAHWQDLGFPPERLP